MVKFLLWCILLVICWPLALLALIAYPFVWLLLLPFRIVGIAVDGVFALLKAILFDGDSSRLYQSLVKKEAAALEVRGTLEERRGPGQLAVFVIHKTDVKGEDVQAIIEAEIERVKRDGITAGELAKVKNQYRLSRFTCESALECTGLQTALGRALELAEFSLFDGDPSLINSELDRYFAVNPEQVRDAARRLFIESNKAVLFIRPAKPQ